MKRTSLLLASVAVIAVVATALLIGPLAPATGPSAEETEISSDKSLSPGLAPGSAALRATINPETGGVEVSTIQLPMAMDAETQNALRRDDEGLVQVYHPNGAVSVNLEGRFQNVSVARIDRDGKLVICSENAEQIDGVLQKRPGNKPATRESLEVR